jgi:hypothetical protein
MRPLTCLTVAALALAAAACGYGDPVSPAAGEGFGQLMAASASNSLLPGGTAAVFRATGADTSRFAPESVVVTLRNLQRLGTGAYTAWYVNPSTRTAKPATGRYVRKIGTATADSSAAVSSFAGGPGTITFVTRPYREIGNADVSDSLTHLLITVEASDAATAPSAAQPLWVRVLKVPGVGVGGSLSFGEFNFGEEVPPRIFRAQGSLQGGVIGTTVLRDTVVTVEGETDTIQVPDFRGSVLNVRLTNLQRPPTGYRYRAYLCTSRDANAACAPTDTSTRFLTAGALAGPDEQSLENADTDPTSANLSPTRILSAFLVFDVATNAVSGQPDAVCNYDRFQVALEPKSGSSPPLAIVFNALLPQAVIVAHQCL